MRKYSSVRQSLFAKQKSVKYGCELILLQSVEASVLRTSKKSKSIAVFQKPKQTTTPTPPKNPKPKQTNKKPNPKPQKPQSCPRMKKSIWSKRMFAETTQEELDFRVVS